MPRGYAAAAAVSVSRVSRLRSSAPLKRTTTTVRPGFRVRSHSPQYPGVAHLLIRRLADAVGEGNKQVSRQQENDPSPKLRPRREAEYRAGAGQAEYALRPPGPLHRATERGQHSLAGHGSTTKGARQMASLCAAGAITLTWQVYLPGSSLASGTLKLTGTAFD